MTIEELTKVAEIISNLGNDAKEGLLYYLGFTFGIDLVGYGVGILSIVLGYKLLKSVSQYLINISIAVEGMKELRGLFNIGVPGMLVNSEIKDIVSRVRKLLEKEK